MLDHNSIASYIHYEWCTNGPVKAFKILYSLPIFDLIAVTIRLNDYHEDLVREFRDMAEKRSDWVRKIIKESQSNPP